MRGSAQTNKEVALFSFLPATSQLGQGQVHTAMHQGSKGPSTGQRAGAEVDEPTQFSHARAPLKPEICLFCPDGEVVARQGTATFLILLPGLETTALLCSRSGWMQALRSSSPMPFARGASQLWAATTNIPTTATGKGSLGSWQPSGNLLHLRKAPSTGETLGRALLHEEVLGVWKLQTTQHRDGEGLWEHRKARKLF